MKQRTILSSFYTAKDAESAADLAKSRGAEVAQVDELHAYPGDVAARESYIISGEIPSLASITLHTDNQTRDAAILMASDPSASGMADGEGRVTGRNYLLTLICDENQVDEMVNLIKSCDGFT